MPSIDRKVLANQDAQRFPDVFFLVLGRQQACAFAGDTFGETGFGAETNVIQERMNVLLVRAQERSNPDWSGK